MPFKHTKKSCCDAVCQTIGKWHKKCNIQNYPSMIKGRKIKCYYGINVLDEEKEYQVCYNILHKMKDYTTPRRP